MQTVGEIESAIAELEAKRQAVLAEKQIDMARDIAVILGGDGAYEDKVVNVMVEAAKICGIDLSIKVVKPAKPKAPAKYRNPFDHAQTWSGRGKRPAWFDRSREADFLIKDATTNAP